MSDTVDYGPIAGPVPTMKVLVKVVDERRAQDNHWGVQNHNPVEWMSILTEEVGEAAEAANQSHWHDSQFWRQKLRDELAQVAAVAVAAIECLDREDAARESD